MSSPLTRDEYAALAASIAPRAMPTAWAPTTRRVWSNACMAYVNPRFCSPSRRSAGGQELQPCEVKSSTTTGAAARDTGSGSPAGAGGAASQSAAARAMQPKGFMARLYARRTAGSQSTAITLQ